MLFSFSQANFVELKRFVSIALLWVILLNNSELDQLVKIPALIDHYTEHLAQDGNLSFMKFLILHYQNEKHDQNGEHRSLPFKSHECQNLTHVLLMDELKTLQIGMIPNILDIPHPEIKDFYDSENVANIWQPPQFI